MAAGRTSPAAAVLPDGRSWWPAAATTRAFPGRDESAARGSVGFHLPVADASPGPTGHALATAEPHARPPRRVRDGFDALRLPGPDGRHPRRWTLLIVGIGWGYAGLPSARNSMTRQRAGSRSPMPCPDGSHPPRAHGGAADVLPVPVGLGQRKGGLWHRGGMRSWSGRLEPAILGGHRALE